MGQPSGCTRRLVRHEARGRAVQSAGRTAPEKAARARDIDQDGEAEESVAEIEDICACSVPTGC